MQDLSFRGDLIGSKARSAAFSKVYKGGKGSEVKARAAADRAEKAYHKQRATKKQENRSAQQYAKRGRAMKAQTKRIKSGG